MKGPPESPGSYSVCEVEDRFLATRGNIVSFGNPIREIGSLCRISPGAESEHCVPKKKAAGFWRWTVISDKALELNISLVLEVRGDRGMHRDSKSSSLVAAWQAMESTPTKQ